MENQFQAFIDFLNTQKQNSCQDFEDLKYIDTIKTYLPQYVIDFENAFATAELHQIKYPVFAVCKNYVFIHKLNEIVALLTEIKEQDISLQKIILCVEFDRESNEGSINNLRNAVLAGATVDPNATEVEIYYLDDLYDIWNSEKNEKNKEKWNNISIKIADVLSKNSTHKKGLPYLELNADAPEDFDVIPYKGYLTNFPGDAIYRISNQHSYILYNKNIRMEITKNTTINQNVINVITNQPFKLKKNVKIEPKINHPHPYYFFAYNNGMVILSKKVHIEDGLIKQIDGFFIVNGAQTTRAIKEALNSLQKKNSPFPEFYVPVKIIELQNDDESLDTLGFDICFFANTQNQISGGVHSSLASLWEGSFPDTPTTINSNRCRNEKQKIGWFFERRNGLYIAYKAKNDEPDFSKKYQKHINYQQIGEAWYCMENPSYTCLSAANATTQFINDFSLKVQKDTRGNSDYCFFNDAWKQQVIGRYIFYQTGELFLSKVVYNNNAKFRRPYVLASSTFLLNAVLHSQNRHTVDFYFEQQQYVSGHLQLAICKFSDGLSPFLVRIQSNAEKKGMVEFCRDERTWNLLKSILLLFRITRDGIESPHLDAILNAVHTYFDDIKKPFVETKKNTIEEHANTLITAIVDFFNDIQHVPEITEIYIIEKTADNRILLESVVEIESLYEASKNDVNVKRQLNGEKYSYVFCKGFSISDDPEYKYSIGTEFIDTILHGVHSRYIFVQDIADFIFNNKVRFTDLPANGTPSALKSYIREQLRFLFTKEYLSHNDWHTNIEIVNPWMHLAPKSNNGFKMAIIYKK